MADRIKFDSGYFHAPNKIFEYDDLKVHDKVVYLYLCRCGHNSTAFPSYNTIADKCSVSRSSAMRAVKALLEKGLLIKHTRRNSHDERNKSNLYEVVPPSSCETPPGIRETPYKGTTDKQTKETKRHLLTSKQVRVLDYYNHVYKEYFKKDHPTLTGEQLDDMEDKMNEAMSELDISEDDMMDYIEKHFRLLPSNNDGKIQGFLSSNGRSYGVLFRHTQTNYYGGYGEEDE